MSNCSAQKIADSKEDPPYQEVLKEVGNEPIFVIYLGVYVGEGE